MLAKRLLLARAVLAVPATLLLAPIATFAGTAHVATLVDRSNAEAAAAGATRPVTFSLYVATHLQDTPAYAAAVGDATVGQTPATTLAYG